jgi:hypothetical protein
VRDFGDIHIQPSYTRPVNTGCTDNVMSLPADQVYKENFTSLVGSYCPKRVILIEYALVYPAEVAKLLLRIEGSKCLTRKLFCTDRKARKLVGELRNTLSALGVLHRKQEDCIQRTITKAKQVVAVAQRRANEQSSCHQQLQQAVQTARSQPADVDSALCFSRIVNPRRPGNPADNDHIFAAMGSRPDVCSRTASRAGSGSRRQWFSLAPLPVALALSNPMPSCRESSKLALTRGELITALLISVNASHRR